MLQQTRVEAVIPYYERFLARFPSLEALAAASGNDVLALWSGLGYYSRARNLHRAAKSLVADPATYEEVRALPGAGPYTAAAIASITLGLPYAAVDGNVIRVISRLTNDASEVTSAPARRRFAAEAQALLDKQRPGDFNQAMMELGATICLPRTPRCGECPANRFCAARAAGTASELPVKLKKAQAREVLLDLLLIEREGRIFLIRRGGSERRLAGFLELPEKRLFPKTPATKRTQFSHRIVNDQFTINIWTARLPASLPPGEWHERADLAGIPLTTVTKKALARLEL
jgi:A/G-specific adenine glycosylase